MAKQTIVTYVDDLDGKPGAETQRFAVNGYEYEIDLAGENLRAFGEFMSRHMDAGRRLRRATNRKRPVEIQREPARIDKEQNAAIREWARRNGHPELGNRGRIPQQIVDDYNARAGR